ncbi:hypothetical protein [Paenarthrobacter sp. CAP02]|uniref:hypothetical protein n=1 Tax=Paenarthrobacter sp. CAP02 TaxID=3158144 RepID=UPI0032DBF168
MSNRLRNQELTGRPRVIADAGEYKVQWVGKYSGQACEYSYPNFSDAFRAAHNIGYAHRIKA